MKPPIGITSPKIHIPTEQYGFIEAELTGIRFLHELDELADEVRKTSLLRKYNCQHSFTYIVSGTAAKGRAWQKEVCHGCGALRWWNDTAWGNWQFPIQEG